MVGTLQPVSAARLPIVTSFEAAMSFFLLNLKLLEGGRVPRAVDPGSPVEPRPMIKRRIVQTLCATALLMSAFAADGDAAERLRYDVAAFQAAVDAGKPILVHVTAPWCGECKAQKPIVAALADRE